jgi:hypothetical protein
MATWDGGGSFERRQHFIHGFKTGRDAAIANIVEAFGDLGINEAALRGSVIAVSGRRFRNSSRSPDLMPARRWTAAGTVIGNFFLTVTVMRHADKIASNGRIADWVEFHVAVLEGNLLFLCGSVPVLHDEIDGGLYCRGCLEGENAAHGAAPRGFHSRQDRRRYPLIQFAY